MTFADVADPDAVRESVQCRHVAVLADGRRFVLLDECWCSSGTWAVASHEEIEATARAVFEETPRWSALLRERGIATGGDELEALPHDVVLTDRLRARVT